MEDVIAKIVQHVPLKEDLIIKSAGTIGGSSSVVGLTWDTSALSYWVQVLSDIGIFFGGVAAIITIIYTIYKGRNK
jgi:hypothetical protein